MPDSKFLVCIPAILLLSWVLNKVTSLPLQRFLKNSVNPANIFHLMHKALVATVPLPMGKSKE